MDGLDHVFGGRARDAVEDRFGIGGRGENCALAFELTAFGVGKRQVPVVTDGDLPVLAGDGKRLDLFDGVLAGGRVAGVRDGAGADQGFEHFFPEDVGDQADGTKLVEIFAVAGDDAAGLLPAVLERKQAELGKSGRLRVAENAKNTALFVKLVENNIRHLYLFCHARGYKRKRGKVASEIAYAKAQSSQRTE